MYGLLAEQLEKEKGEHLRTIDVLRQLVTGALSLSQVVVDDKGGWRIMPIVPQELPKCPTE